MARTIKKVKYGNQIRHSFSQIKDVLEIPYLIEVQKKSYESFLKHGIGEVLKDYSPITDMSNKAEIYFLDYSLGSESKYNELECKNRDVTYSAPLKVKVRLVIKETGNVVEQDVFLCDMPLMTPNGSFIINGAERVVVSQLVRSPGVYFNHEIDVKSGHAYFSATLIPARGSWFEFTEDSNGLLWVHVDKTRKVLATVLLRCLSAISEGEKFSTNEEMMNLFNNEALIKTTLDKDLFNSESEALSELNRKIRPGELSNSENIKNYLHGILFDRKKYDLTKIGRHKFNQKLALASRLVGFESCEDIISEDGELLVRKGEIITEEKATKIQNSGINKVAIYVNNEETNNSKKRFIVIGNNHVDLSYYLKNAKELGIVELVHGPTLKKLLKEAENKNLKELLSQSEDLVCKHILIDDICSTINYIIGLRYGVGSIDNIDHLGNRRVRSVGELLANQFRVGIARLERTIKERMQVQSDNELTPQSLINVRPVSSAIKEFFGSSQLSQFMDESNPIAELTHKRKLSALGPGGLSRERASFEVRDVHYTHYGRLCPIETPEGQNIGLINSLSTYARVNDYGFIESPYRKVDKQKKVVTDEIYYLSADEEDKYVIAQANEPLDKNSWFVKERVMIRYQDNISETERENVDFMDVSPRQLVSVATALIPFLENDDTNRALMGSNMQRQAVPLLIPESPIIGTGMENKVAYDSGVMVIAQNDGEVVYVSGDEIRVKEEDGNVRSYLLKKFLGSNQGTCINQRPIVNKNDKIKKGMVIADGHSTQNTELALGKNILIGFMSWEGYNYEDAILINEKLVKDDVFTSIHIEKHEIEARDTKLGEEDITRDIPNVGEDAIKNLDEDGIIRVGAEVSSGDILVGKVTPKGETDLTPEERLLRAIFGEKAREVRDTSLRVPHGEGGIVVDVKVFTRANKDEMSPGVNKLVRVYIAQKRKISVGDKMAGRHGNKGVISKIVPEEDMPFLADGTPLEIILNPLGVPSRMNIGQLLEVHLGLIAKSLGWHVALPVFDGATEADIKELLKENKICEGNNVDGKIKLFDGRTGELFENNVTVGYMYMLKLVHLVDDKIHARSTGPYSLVTQQPLGGKAQFGGQRFGEMEVWALYAYGAAHVLQEIMTVKSDDVSGRVKTYESIVKDNIISEPGVPESFKVLIKELQSLALDIKVLNERNQEIGIRDILEEEINNEYEEENIKHYAEGKFNDDTIDIMNNETLIEEEFEDFMTDEDEAEEELEEDLLLDKKLDDIINNDFSDDDDDLEDL